MEWWTAICLLFMVGCGGTSPDSMREAYVISETARFATQLGVRVSGQITDGRGPDGCAGQAGCESGFAWLDGDTAYFNRSWVNGDAPDSLLSQVAAHETCHAIAKDHSLLHWQCSAQLSTPTYPRP